MIFRSNQSSHDLEAFLLFSQDIPTANLGFVDSRATTVEVTIRGDEYSIHQSPTLLSSSRAGGTTGAGRFSQDLRFLPQVNGCTDSVFPVPPGPRNSSYLPKVSLVRLVHALPFELSRGFGLGLCIWVLSFELLPFWHAIRNPSFVIVVSIINDDTLAHFVMTLIHLLL